MNGGTLAITTFTDAGVQTKINELSKRSRGKTEEQKVDAVASDFEGRFKLGDGRLQLPDLRFEVPGAKVELAGVYALCGHRYLMVRIVQAALDALYAARGGANSVTDLDISAHALSSAARNFGLNAHFPGVASCPRESIQADAFEWLASDRRQFGLVILDPPSLAKRESERSRAIGVAWQARSPPLVCAFQARHRVFAEHGVTGPTPCARRT